MGVDLGLGIGIICALFAVVLTMSRWNIYSSVILGFSLPFTHWHHARTHSHARTRAYTHVIIQCIHPFIYQSFDGVFSGNRFLMFLWPFCVIFWKRIKDHYYCYYYYYYHYYYYFAFRSNHFILGHVKETELYRDIKKCPSVCTSRFCFLANPTPWIAVVISIWQF